MSGFNCGKMQHIFKSSTEDGDDSFSYIQEFYSPEAAHAIQHGKIFIKIDGSNGALVRDKESGKFTLWRRFDDKKNKYIQHPDYVNIPQGKNLAVYQSGSRGDVRRYYLTKIPRDKTFKQLYKNGKYHRVDRENGKVLAACIWSNGDQEWWRDGKRHRNDLDEKGRVLPAIIYSNGSQEWYTNGKCHRDERDGCEIGT